MFLESKCPIKERQSPSGTLNLNMFSGGGDGLSLGHFLRIWWTGKISYAGINKK
jgi:hypothetical protein